MIRIVWILALFGAITGVTSNIAGYPLNFEWLFGRKGVQVIERSNKERSLCDADQCKVLANILTESMNKTADPCEDFYEYACGNWEMHNPLPKNENRWNLLIRSQRNVDKKLIEILEQDSSGDSILAVKLAKRAYKACMNTDEIERSGLVPIVSTLWRIGGWPLIMEEDEWDEVIYKWQTVDDYYARLIGLNSLYEVRVGQLDWHVDHTSILIDSPRVPLNMYKLIRGDVVNWDSSEENDDSRGGSQEQGSEERRDSREDEGEDEDEEELQTKRAHRGKMNKRPSHNKSKSNKIKEIGRHVAQKKMKKRAKTAVIKTSGHNKEQCRQRKVTNHRVHHATRKSGRVPKHEQMTLTNHVKESARKNDMRNEMKNKNMNNDFYFNGDDGKGDGHTDVREESGRNDDNADDEENGSVSEDNEEKDEGNGSGSGDGNTWDDEDGSGSGDGNTWDDEDGSGSGDYGNNEWDDEDGSGSGDYSDNEWDEEDGSGDHGDDGKDDEEGDSCEDGNDIKDTKQQREIEGWRKKYAEYMLNVSLALAEARGVPIPKEKLMEDIDEVMKFQLSLLRLAYIYEGAKNTTLRSFQTTYDALKPTTNNGKINWIKSVQDLFATGGMEVDSDAIVGITSFDYIKCIRKLLDKTSSKAIVNYIHWNFLSKVIKVTTTEMKELYYNWEGTQRNEKRSDECIDEIEARYCLGYEYVRRYFSHDILQTASDMIDDIQKEVEYQIKQSTWMDDDTKEFVLVKLVYMKKQLGYPGAYRNTTIMKEHFRGLSISRSHYENKLGIMRYIKRKNLRTLFRKEDVNQQYIDPSLVNAFFSIIENAIEITAADFQSPLFDARQPWYTNFGIIGFIMAHEVNHGFDDTGHSFDKDGNYMRWLSAMAEAYEKRAECFEDQFTRYSVVENKTANIPIKDYGRRTADENIADSQGLQAVFRAYQRMQRKCKEIDPMLPGLENFTNEQIFFLSFANLWCEVIDAEFMVQKSMQDLHSLGALRVIGSVSNSEDFAKAYNCPAGSPMNPKKKCSIWK